MVVSFINFSKTSDSIHRPILWRIVESYRVLTKLVSTIEKINKNFSYCVQTEDRYISWFQFLTGVWQGCIKDLGIHVTSAGN